MMVSTRRPVLQLQLLMLMLTIQYSAYAARFAVSGPVLTVTLKEPQTTTTTITSEPDASGSGTSSSTSQTRNVLQRSNWIDLASLRPNLFWSIQSLAKPLPNWLPSLQSIRANVGYRYDEDTAWTKKKQQETSAIYQPLLPTFVEGTARFRNERLESEMMIQPSYELQSQRANLVLQLTQGASYLLTRWTTRRSSRRQTYYVYPDEDDEKGEQIVPKATSTSSSTISSPGIWKYLDMIRASYQVNFPAGSSVSHIRITPSYDVTNQEPTCVVEGVTGGSARTKAVLKLQTGANPSTLTVVHALDDRNTIAPEISLRNAKITYQWNLALSLDGTSSIRTKVDPTSAIQVTWTDTSTVDGGRWVTDIRLPLEGTSIRALASDVRVRRQFNF